MKKTVSIFIFAVLFAFFAPVSQSFASNNNTGVYCYMKGLLQNTSEFEELFEESDRYTQGLTNNAEARIKLANYAGRIEQAVNSGEAIETPSKSTREFHSLYENAINQYDRAAILFREAALDNDTDKLRRGLRFMRRGHDKITELVNALNQAAERL